MRGLLLSLLIRQLIIVIIVCNKYYLDVVLRELESTCTYKEACSNSDSVVDRHVDYMMRNG